jgi:hypothetical protein
MSFAWSLGCGVFLAMALCACSSGPAGDEETDEGALAETTTPAAPKTKQHVFVSSGEGKKAESDPRMTYFESERTTKLVAIVVCSRDDRTVDYSVMDSVAPMTSNTIVAGRYPVPSGDTCTKFVQRLAVETLSGKRAIRVRVTDDAIPELQSIEAIDHRATRPCDAGTYLKPDGFCG